MMFVYFLVTQVKFFDVEPPFQTSYYNQILGFFS
jgi:hypothetical protein